MTPHQAILAGIITLSFFLAGCDRLSGAMEKSANQNAPQEIVDQVKNLASKGALAEALQEGEKYLRTSTETNTDLHRVLADLYIEAGTPQAALHHLQKSIETCTAPCPPLADYRAQPTPPSGNANHAGASARVDGISAETHGSSAKASASP